MDIRHPIRSLTWAWAQALEHDLAGVDADTGIDAATAAGAPAAPRRPRADECSVVLFTQCWTAGALGFADRRPGESVEADTVVVTGPAGDACVYASTRLLYRVARPNRRFFLDLAAQCMGPVGTQAAYHGRDSADLEAIDYEVEGALARACGAARRLGAAESARLAGLLSGCVQRYALDAAAVMET